MLLELNVRDIALIKKARVEFGGGLNILTGETGAGKSVIIGSAMLALGQRLKGDIVRKGAESGYVELVFDVEGDGRLRALKELGIEPDDSGLIVISRRIMHGKSISRINDETVTLQRLKDAAAYLMDICGQNEFHSLTDSRNHLQILDEFLGEDAAGERALVKAAYKRYADAQKRMRSFGMDESERLRRRDLLSYQVSEIESAHLKPGEEEELSSEFKRLNNARNIMDYVADAHRELGDFRIDRAIGAIESAMRYDEGLSDIYRELSDAQSVLDAALRDLSSYAESLEVDEGELSSMEKRLDLIRSLEAKYGSTVEEIDEYLAGISSELLSMDNYEEDRKKAAADLDAAGRALDEACAKLGRIRKQGAIRLGEAITGELKDLGFRNAVIELSLTDKAPSADGSDEALFMAALNPGEDLKPISEAASGGELSRIMLAIKTVLARSDDTPTIIFDEIDTGISGRTAQSVADKLDVIAMEHQVICVSHLPQIAAYADVHYLISKEEDGGRNLTSIEKLDDEGAIEELARLLGGVNITRAVMDNASEMRQLALSSKRLRREERNSTDI